MDEVLISPEYQAEQARMHRDIDSYGVECLRYGATIGKMVKQHEIKTLLDYGSGKGRIVQALSPYLEGQDLTVTLYDPGVPDLAVRPEPAEMVTCIDVLEHVEPQYTIGVLHDLARVTQRVAMITIGLTPAGKVLSDGRNAHINLRPSNEWLAMLMEHFECRHFTDSKRSMIFVGVPR